MGEAHNSENRFALGFQGAGMPTPHWQTQRWSAPNEVDRRHSTSRWKPLETSSAVPWVLGLLTKDLCSAVDFNRLK
ncbi:jg4973 [Pararge aegeria aegeria]|uniref:Jg4973 protein n=1 Tax=Pararge aegeria aegeria TaxID=348720 RepID=A0A8S4SK16_9NEOP|nr:jg4973 [Pararge aegeria aegeria]